MSSQPPQVVTAPDPESEQSSAPVFLTDSYRNAIERLERSFRDRRSLEIIIGEGRSAAEFVVARFLSQLDAEVAIAEISEPCSNAIEVMRSIIRAVGFDPKDMSLADLDSIFKMFLCFQKGHRRRTVVVIEELQDYGWWALDKIRSLIEFEGEGKYGILFIITGQPHAKALLSKRPLESVCSVVGQRINLAPFSSAETREYIRRRVEARDNVTIDKAFEYHAINVLHELCSGVPDDIATLVSLSRDLADETRSGKVTTDIVRRAHARQHAADSANDCDAEGETLSLNGFKPLAGHLIVQMTGDDVREKSLSNGHVLLGRSKLCDVRIDRPNVSRHHALIVYRVDGATLIDLGSTNGTYVDGYRINHHELVAGETISIGECRIEYVLDDERRAGHSTSHKFGSVKPPPN